MRDRGFTLIETVIAMALLAFIVADVGMVAMHASRTASASLQLTGAVTLAENAIEHARNADFNNLRLTDNPQALCLTRARAAVACGDPSAEIVQECFVSSLERTACGGVGFRYALERDVSTPAGTTLETTLSAQIDVLVTWVDSRGAAQEFRLASVVSKF